MDKLTELHKKIYKSTPARNIRDRKSTEYFVRFFKDSEGLLVLIALFLALSTLLYTVDYNNVINTTNKIINGFFITSLYLLRFISLLIIVYLIAVFLIHLFQNFKRRYNVYLTLFTALMLALIFPLYIFMYLLNDVVITNLLFLIGGLAFLYYLGYKYFKFKDSLFNKVKNKYLRISARIISAAFLAYLLISLLIL